VTGSAKHQGSPRFAAVGHPNPQLRLEPLEIRIDEIDPDLILVEPTPAHNELRFRIGRCASHRADLEPSADQRGTDDMADGSTHRDPASVGGLAGEPAGCKGRSRSEQHRQGEQE